MYTDSLAKLLISRRACPAAIAWAKGRSVDEAAYLACPRGDWLLWLLARLGLPRPQLVLAACACARTALKYVPAGEERPLRAIEVAEAWARGAPGAPTLAEVQAASVDAHAAAADAETYAAAAATHAAAVAAYAAVADAAAAYAASAADAAAHAKALAECADLVRDIVPWEDVARLLRERSAAA